MSQRFLFLLGGHLRRLAGIEADENNLVVAAGIEGEHAQHADDTLFHLIAEHRAAVINEGENYGLLPEILTEPNAAAGLVAEEELQRHRPVERRRKSDVLQSRGHGRSSRAGVAGNCLRAQHPRRQQERGNSDGMANFFHGLISFSPPARQARGTNPFRQ